MRGFDLVVQRLACVRDAKGHTVGQIGLFGDVRGGDLADFPPVALEALGMGVGCRWFAADAGRTATAARPARCEIHSEHWKR